jgi:hypothetical protein
MSLTIKATVGARYVSVGLDRAREEQWTIAIVTADRELDCSLRSDNTSKVITANQWLIDCEIAANTALMLLQ